MEELHQNSMHLDGDRGIFKNLEKASLQSTASSIPFS